MSSETPAESAPPPAEEPVYVELMIVKDSGDLDCKMEGAAGDSLIIAPRGSYVTFINETETDVNLRFDTAKRLFGVKEGIVYAMSKQTFQVRDDALVDKHECRTDCRTNQPGAVIEVPPPPPGGGG